jgi:ribonuclease HII
VKRERVSGPTLDLERCIRQETGLSHIAGLDEAGRGAIAGPVVAAAVILPLDQLDIASRLQGVNDSKQLSAGQRERFFDLICRHALAYGIGHSSEADIDRLGIIPANAQAMRRALAQLKPAADYLLLDGRMKLKTVPLAQQSIIRGDQISLSIAAASILAKVSRDREMVALDAAYPGYGFSRHKGYCTRFHEAALAECGPCPAHRQTFAPIRQPLL